MSQLDKLINARIFSVKLSEDKKKLNLKEECDQCFDIDLNKQEVLELLRELADIMDQMEYSNDRTRNT